MSERATERERLTDRIAQALRSWRSRYWTQGMGGPGSGLVDLLGDDEGSIHTGDVEVEEIAAHVADSLSSPSDRGGDVEACKTLARAFWREKNTLIPVLYNGADTPHRQEVLERFDRVINEVREQMAWSHARRRRLRAASTDAPSDVPPTCPECDNPMKREHGEGYEVWRCERSHPAVWRRYTGHTDRAPTDAAPERERWALAEPAAAASVLRDIAENLEEAGEILARRLRQPEPAREGEGEAEKVASFIVGWWPGLEGGLPWGDESALENHPVKRAAERILARSDATAHHEGGS